MSTQITEHVDGVSWLDAPIPRRFHKCEPQTIGRHNGRVISRCACGASRLDEFAWFNKNSRRQKMRMKL